MRNNRLKKTNDSAPIKLYARSRVISAWIHGVRQVILKRIPKNIATKFRTYKREPSALQLPVIVPDTLHSNRSTHSEQNNFNNGRIFDLYSTENGESIPSENPTVQYLEIPYSDDNDCIVDNSCKELKVHLEIKHHTTDRKVPMHCEDSLPISQTEKIIKPLYKCHDIFTSTSLENVDILCKIVSYLDVKSIGRICSTVNSTFNLATKRYYQFHCPYPRPHGYLLSLLCTTQTPNESSLIAYILSYISQKERVTIVSLVSHQFLRAVWCKLFPLEIKSSTAVSKFIRTAFDRERFFYTTKLILRNMNAQELLQIVELMDSDWDHISSNDSIEDIPENASARRHISLPNIQQFGMYNISGFKRCGVGAQLFARFVQVLYSQHVSSTLQDLTLSDIDISEGQFQQLHSLFCNQKFPKLIKFSLAYTQFSKHAMRSLSQNFTLRHFYFLQELSIASIGVSTEDMKRFINDGLPAMPFLRALNISNNYCSVDTVKDLAQQFQSLKFTDLRKLDIRAICADSNATKFLFRALGLATWSRGLQHLLISSNLLSAVESITELGRNIPSGNWAQLVTLDLAFMNIGESGFPFIGRAWIMGAASSLLTLKLDGNRIRSSFKFLLEAMRARKLCKLLTLSLCSNELSPVEIEDLSFTLSQNSCPQLQELDLSDNNAGSEGAKRFCSALLSSGLSNLRAVNLSQNKIPMCGLVDITQSLQNAAFLPNLYLVNLAHNEPAYKICMTPFHDFIRSSPNNLVSLRCFLVGSVQTVADGYAFYKKYVSSADKKTRQEKRDEFFNAQVQASEVLSVRKAEIYEAQCKRQTAHMRTVYDHMENEAARALRRRKRIRKPRHLTIYREMGRKLQEHYYRKVELEAEKAQKECSRV